MRHADMDALPHAAARAVIFEKSSESGSVVAELRALSVFGLGSGLINCQKVCKRVLIVCQEVSYEYSLLSFPCPA